MCENHNKKCSYVLEEHFFLSSNQLAHLFSISANMRDR